MTRQSSSITRSNPSLFWNSCISETLRFEFLEEIKRRRAFKEVRPRREGKSGHLASMLRPSEA
jgi:hypothetical protein